MNPIRWRSVQEIFSRATELPPDMDATARRRAVLDLCDGDEEIFAEVTEMLDEDGRQHALLDGGLPGIVCGVLDSGSLPTLIERQIGPYRLVRMLGEGGMGIVYLAERTDIGGHVAIKFLRDAWLSPMRRERFSIEEFTLAQLNHPGIARIYDAGTLEEGTPWFVMEYAEGVPLNEHRKAHGGSLRNSLVIFQRVCEAVQYAHNHAIIHRDLKPSNILVGENGQVKLLDFGIAKHLNNSDSRNRTITGLQLMTLAYAAPEQLSGAALGLYTDVYALGVLLYEVVTGTLPCRSHFGETPHALVRWAQEKPSAVVRRSHPELCKELSKAEWADLDVLTRKAMEPDFSIRYRNADALLRDITALLAGQPLEARPAEWAYRFSRFIHRNLRGVVVLAAALLAIAITAAFYTVRLAGARDAALREAARTLRMRQFTDSLFEGGDKSAGPAADLKVVEMLDHGRNEIAGLSGDPEMQADMQETLGTIYQKLGKLELAEPLLTSALANRRRIFGPAHPRVAASLSSLALLRKDQGKMDEAETLARQAVDLSQQLRVAIASDRAAALVALGSVLVTHGKYEEAKSTLDRALLLQPDGDTSTRADNIEELANVAFYQGNYDLAGKLNHQALEMNRRLFGEQHPAIADILNNLGAIEMNRGDFLAAESSFRQALAIAEKWYGPDHPETAANLTALAQTLTSENQLSEAESLLKRAVAIQKHQSGPVRGTLGTTLNQLGVLAFQQDRYDEARQYFTEAMAVWKQLYGDQHPFIANAISNLGSICLKQKDYPCAERMYRDAERRFDSSAPDSLSAAVARIKLGRTLLREGRFREAEPQTLAGYRYLVSHVGPDDNYLQASRKDLGAIYDGMGNPQMAAQYRAMLPEGPAKKP
jgi:eukaryotic-like serine/threonine-protein kinase